MSSTRSAAAVGITEGTSDGTGEGAANRAVDGDCVGGGVGSADGDVFQVKFCVVDEEHCGDLNPLACDPQSIVHLKGFALRLQMPKAVPEEVLCALGQHEAIVFDGDNLARDSFTALLPLFYLDMHLKNQSDARHSHSQSTTDQDQDRRRDRDPVGDADADASSATATATNKRKRELPHLVAFKWHERTESEFKQTWHNAVATVSRSADTFRVKYITPGSDCGGTATVGSGSGSPDLVTLTVNVHLRKVTTAHVQTPPGESRFYEHLGVYAIQHTKARKVVSVGGGPCVAEEAKAWGEDVHILLWDVPRWKTVEQKELERSLLLDLPALYTYASSPTDSPTTDSPTSPTSPTSASTSPRRCTVVREESS